jgi:hypothetical protein
MTTELEERLASLERELKAAKRQLSTKKKYSQTLHSSKKWLIAASTALLVVAACTVIAYTHHASDNRHLTSKKSPVPESIRNAAGYPISYPDPAKIPASFRLDATSFTSTEGATIYAIYRGSEKLIFSEQAKPNDSVIQDFNTKQIPLHTTFKTAIGMATLGAINNQQVASIPTDTSWIIVTGPGDLTQADLKDLLDSFVY